MKVKSIDWSNIDGEKMFSLAAAHPGTYAEIERVCAAKAADIGSQINAIGGGSFSNPTAYEVVESSLRSRFPQGKVFTTSRGAYRIAVSHGLFHW